MVNKGSESDFLIPTLITFILLQILTFIISIILSLLWYNGLKKENRTLVNIAKTFLFYTMTIILYTNVIINI